MRKGKKRVKKSVKVQEFTVTTPAPAKGQLASGQAVKDGSPDQTLPLVGNESASAN